ncbi:MAG: tetratricopeptide repeat protein [Thainema sp.]
MGTNSFVGRDQDLVRLDEQLQQENRIVITAVTGMGGVGKTELAVQYAQRYWHETFPGGVCWLSARGTEGDADIGTQMITFGKSYLGLNPPEDLDVVGQVAFCWRQWPRFDPAAQKPELVLVVLDDVTDYRQVEPYLPRDDRFTVLMTTRVELGSRIAKLPIGVLARADALDLLRQLAEAERIDAEPETADALCEWLGDLPLGLELVGRFLARKPDLSLAELRCRLEEQELQARALKQTEEGMTANLGVASAFELSWQELSEEAQELACLLSCFALAPIPWERVEACLPEADAEELEDWRDDELVRLSLLKRVETGRYQYHQLIQRFIRTKLPEDSALIGAYCHGMVAAAKEIGWAPTQAQILAWSEMVPHVEESATHWIAQVADDELARPFTGLGCFYGGQGLYTQAEPWYEKCVAVTRDRLGEENLYIATSLNNLAGLYRVQGRYSEAEPLYVQALAMRKQLLGEQHPDIATSLGSLAGLYHAQGRYSEAKPLYVQALEMHKRLLGEEHPYIATSLNNLAELYHAQSRYSEAKPLYVQALEMHKRLLGEEHPYIATSLNNLARLYSAQGRYSEAEPLYVEALELRKCLLGEEHPDIATSLGSLAGLYCDQGRYSEAEPLYVQALEMDKRLLGEEHPYVATSLNNLAVLYRDQGRYSEAEPLYQQALALRKQLLGKEHPNVATSLNNLAGLYYSQGQYSEAEPLYQQALTLRKQLLGEEHPDVATSLNNLAGLYYSQGQYSEAEPLYAEALRILLQVLGETHPNTRTVRSNFIYCLQQALAANQANTLSDHPLTQQLLAQLQFQPPAP